MKAWTQAIKGEKMTPTVEYLRDFVSGNRKEKFECTPQGILRAFQRAAAGKVAIAYKKLELRKKSMTHEDAANQTGIEMAAASEVHCQVFLLKTSIEVLENAAKSATPAMAQVFRDILDLYAVDLALQYMGSLLQFGSITGQDLDKLQQQLEDGLKKLRYNGIGLVDGFDIPDEVLGSVLGQNDGNVYDHLLDAAMESPLNHEDVNESFHKYLKPYMKSNL